MIKGIPGHNRKPDPVPPARPRVCSLCGREVPEGERLIIEASTNPRVPARQICDRCEATWEAERVRAMPDGEGMCTACWGRGGEILRQDPVGDGRGYEVLVDPCPDCLGQGLCPWCGAALVGGVRAERCEECRWTAERIGERDSD